MGLPNGQKTGKGLDMKLTTLAERIEKAEAKITKKQSTIDKKLARIEKLSKELADKFGIDPETFDRYQWRTLPGTEDENNKAYWTLCDIEHLKEDIERGESEIEETKATLKKYKAQYAGEVEREAILLKDIPDSMKQMQTELVETWDEYDKERRERLRREYNELGYKEFCKKHNNADYEFRYKTDEEIHEDNITAARDLILNLYYRVREITGEVTSWAGIHATVGTWGGTVLNGLVEGKEGRAIVESITAGGYNIQRLHIRVLVKEVK